MFALVFHATRMLPARISISTLIVFKCFSSSDNSSRVQRKWAVIA